MDLKLTSKISFFILCIVASNSTKGTQTDGNMLLNKLSIANNDFGLKLYRTIIKGTNENVFFSPLSLSSAFGIAFAGTAGKSAEQLRSALGYDAAQIPDNGVPAAFHEYLKLLLPTNQSVNTEYILNLVNVLLIAEDFRVNSNYKIKVHDLFYAHIKKVDFQRNSSQIAQEVNELVNQQSRGKISLDLSSPDPSTVMLILNVIYFKGKWNTPFKKDQTKPGVFYNRGSYSKGKYVPFMHLTANFLYTSIDSMQVIEFPYKGESFSMIVLLPDNNRGLYRLETSITAEKLIHIQKQMQSTRLIVTFPKFKFEYTRTLNSDLKEMGAKDIFEPGSANFSGIELDKGIYVNEVIHKAFIDVNEQGSEAVARTRISARAKSGRRRSPTPEFTVDHPFMFAIIDKRNDLILFMGRVTEL